MNCPLLSSTFRKGVFVVLCALGLVAAGTLEPAPAAMVETSEAELAAAAAGPNRYIGAAKCKNCHKADAGGNQFAHWEASDHAKAFEVLASPEAKAAAAKLGIEDPQKSESCLKCHVTAFGVAAEEIAAGFKPELGVQCESCHGPGETHMKARFAAAAKAKPGEPVVLGEGELPVVPDNANCIACHNPESPTFKTFCFRTHEPKIRHLDPRRPVSDERKAGLELACKCTAENHTCTHGEAGSACDEP